MRAFKFRKCAILAVVLTGWLWSTPWGTAASAADGSSVRASGLELSVPPRWEAQDVSLARRDFSPIEANSESLVSSWNAGGAQIYLLAESGASDTGISTLERTVERVLDHLPGASKIQVAREVIDDRTCVRARLELLANGSRRVHELVVVPGHTILIFGYGAASAEAPEVAEEFEQIIRTAGIEDVPDVAQRASLWLWGLLVLGVLGRAIPRRT
ncbi:MAG: hypothetical protein AAF488_16385 [Planctomycetota bacterium]